MESIHPNEGTTICNVYQLQEDQKYLIQKAGLRNIITPQWRNSGGAKTMHKGVSSNDLMKMHYSQLTMYQISQLFELYRLVKNISIIS